MDNAFAILDFGSQVSQLIARRLRELGVYSELFPFDVELSELKKFNPRGIILSGGPSSVKSSDSPVRDVKELVDLAPTLGICYGMQLMAHQLGGKVEPDPNKEYGENFVRWEKNFSKNLNLGLKHRVWMSHGDVVLKAPEGAEIIAYSQSNHPAAFKGERIWGVQFHPEVHHTDHGAELLKAFVFELCGAKATWSAHNIVEHILEELKKKVPANSKVLCALSGGVDSTVTATLLTRAFGAENVHCVFVNNGLLRKNEYEEVLEKYRNWGLNVKGSDATEVFLSALKGISDPETKRKTIGRLFIEIFEEELKEHPEIEWLAQGTLYPDVIESVNLRGSSVTIKSHHNVGGLPEKMKLKLVEPLRELFKDEVRAIGEDLGIPKDFLYRHPFPGPGLAVRILGAIEKEDVEILQEADAVFIQALREEGLYDYIWQAYVALLPIRSVGVQGDGRTYGRSVVLRAVTSVDGMTADWFEFPPGFLRKISNSITNKVQAINRVVYDVTSKPPATIEWE